MERDTGGGCGRGGVEYISQRVQSGSGDGRFAFVDCAAAQESEEEEEEERKRKAETRENPSNDYCSSTPGPMRMLRTSNCHLYVRAVDAHIIKHLISTIAAYNRTMTLNYTPKGIFIDEIDSTMRTIIRVKLRRERFGIGAFHTSDEVPVTVSLPKLYKHTRGVKKKDTIEMFLDKNLELTMRTKQPSAQRHHETIMRVQTSQCQQTDYPADFEGPVVVVASDLQKMCKDIDLRSGQSVTITALKSGAVEFTSSEMNGFVKTCTTLGEISETFSQPQKQTADEFQSFVRTYDPDQIRNLMRMTPLSGQVRIYMKPGHYIRFSTDVGTYGNLDIYLKSNEGGTFEDNAP
jgi:hypothetical protein